MKTPVKIITEGDVFYAEAVRAIRRAHSTVSFMVYIWQDDEVGRQFETALIQAARRHVSVQLVIDAVGSFDLPVAAITRMREAGVLVYMHHRIKILRWGWLRYLIRRNHRKIIVIDDRLAFTGGFNIMRECSRRFYGQRRWLDMMIETKVPALVAHLRQQYHDACRRARHEKWTSRLLTRSGNRVIVCGGERIVTYSMSRWLKRRLRHARAQITVAVPYFIPYGFFWRILAKKLKEGVRVEVILSEASDLPWIDAISFAMASRLRKKGADIYLYRGNGEMPRFSHTKIFRIDDWVGTGSANYDYRSMVLNLDTLLFFRHAPGGWNSAYAALRSQSRMATEADLKPGFRAWLIWPLRWLL